MKVPVTVIGFALVVFGRTIFGLIRANYLKQASKNVSMDVSKEIILRYAFWYYIYPLLCLGLSVIFAWNAFTQTNVVRFRFDVSLFLFFFVGGLWLSYRQWKARVVITDSKLTYTEGDRWEISANEVDSVRLTGFTFIIKKRSEKVVQVPATFEHSEIILAFLRKAAINKE